MKQRLISVFTIGGLLLIIVVMCIGISGIDKKKDTPEESTASFSETLPTVPTSQIVTTVQPTTQQTVPEVVTSVADAAATTAVSSTAPSQDEVKESQMPQTTQEIIDKYSLLVNKFKKTRPAYKKKEFQSLPEEHRNFGGAVNVLLDIASGYMVSEEDCEELVRAPGAEEILYDMPIHNSDTACVLKDYDAVEWAKCEDLGNGTYQISFSLKEELNAAPTPADTLIPTSAHGAVMQPVSFAEIMTEVEKVTASVPIINLNDFSLMFRDCEFICVYNPETDEVQSITHHIVIDITADIKFLSADIKGSARLLNEMFIYDITW